MSLLKTTYTDNPTSEEINILYQVLTQQAFEKRGLPSIKHWDTF